MSHWHIRPDNTDIKTGLYTERLAKEDFSKDCPGTRYGASPARNDCDVCVSGLIWHLFRSWRANHRSLLCSSLFQWTHDESFTILCSFPLSNEPRKHGLAALCQDEGANSRRDVSESTVLCSGCFLRKIFTFLLMPKSLWTLPFSIMAKQGKRERFLRKIFTFLLMPKSPWTLPFSIMAKQGKLVASWKQMQCHRCFFFAHARLRGSALVQWNERATKQRNARPWEKACSWSPVGQMMKPLPIESWRKARGCSPSKVKFVKDPAVERPTRDVGQHAVCVMIQTSKTYCRKSKAILFGLRSCRCEACGITSRRGREKK